MKELPEKEFADRLAGIVAAIKRDAKGRTCGDCAHLRGDWCDGKTNVEGHSLRVYYPSAVACNSWLLSNNHLTK